MSACKNVNRDFSLDHGLFSTSAMTFHLSFLFYVMFGTLKNVFQLANCYHVLFL